MTATRSPAVVAATLEQRIARLGLARTCTPRTVESVWIDTAKALHAEGNSLPTKSEAAEILRVLDRLYRQRRIDLAHARILRIYGLKGTPPCADNMTEIGDARLWREAIEALTFPLRCKGLVP